MSYVVGDTQADEAAGVGDVNEARHALAEKARHLRHKREKRRACKARVGQNKPSSLEDEPRTSFPAVAPASALMMAASTCRLHCKCSSAKGPGTIHPIAPTPSSG